VAEAPHRRGHLNVAEWGPGLFGAETAARAHFGVAAASLSRRQRALLAAVLPNPACGRRAVPPPISPTAPGSSNAAWTSSARPARLHRRQAVGEN
jgi:membrane peptidoglycan carboxypeptidase